MFYKYSKYILFTLVLFIFPTFVGKIGSITRQTGDEAYLNWESIHLRGEIEEFRAFNKGIARFGEIIRVESEKYGWDWRLIAAIIFRESGFNPKVLSPAGAAGLMQLMPETVRKYGIRNVTDPTQNIHGGIRMLNWLNDRYITEIPDRDERIKFILASYNAGFGRMKEAREMAEKQGKNPQLWDENVEFIFSGQYKDRFRSGSLNRYGSSGNGETSAFVQSVLGYYNRFIAFLPY